MLPGNYLAFRKLFIHISMVHDRVSFILLKHCLLYIFTATNCNLGDVRLVGGINSREGRVEVCANGVTKHCSLKIFMTIVLSHDKNSRISLNSRMLNNFLTVALSMSGT